MNDKVLIPQVLPSLQEGVVVRRKYDRIPQHIKDTCVAYANAGYSYRIIASWYNISHQAIAKFRKQSKVDNNMLSRHLDVKKTIKLKIANNLASDKLIDHYQGDYNPNVIECLATIDRTSQEIDKIESKGTENIAIYQKTIEKYMVAIPQEDNAEE